MYLQAENAVSSFFFYMWNAWSEEECKAVYGNMYPHFWEKWCVATDKGTVLSGTLGRQPQASGRAGRLDI